MNAQQMTAELDKLTNMLPILILCCIGLAVLTTIGSWIRSSLATSDKLKKTKQALGFVTSLTRLEMSLVRILLEEFSGRSIAWAKEYLLRMLNVTKTLGVDGRSALELVSSRVVSWLECRCDDGELGPRNEVLAIFLYVPGGTRESLLWTQAELDGMASTHREEIVDVARAVLEDLASGGEYLSNTDPLLSMTGRLSDDAKQYVPKEVTLYARTRIVRASAGTRDTQCLEALETILALRF